MYLVSAQVAYGWGLAAHVVIARDALGTRRPEVLAGAMMADMNQAMLDDTNLLSEMSLLTHLEFGRLAPSCFRLGFASHNNDWGADVYTHQYWLPDILESEYYYTTRKIYELAHDLNISLGRAEFYVEMAVDYLLRLDEGPELGDLMIYSALAVGNNKINALAAAFAEPLSERVPDLTLVQAADKIADTARLFKLMILAYGFSYRDQAALNEALITMGAYYLKENAWTVAYNLSYAVNLCRDDYREELTRISEILRPRLEAFAPEQVHACTWGCARSGKTTAAPSPASMTELALLLLFPAAYRIKKARKPRHK